MPSHVMIWCDVELNKERTRDRAGSGYIERRVGRRSLHVITIGYYTHKGRKHDVKAVRKLSDISSSSIQESSGRGEEIHILVRGGGQGMVRIKWDAGWRWEGIAQHVLTEAFV